MFGTFPSTFAFDGLIDNFFIKFDIDGVNKRIQLFIDKSHIVFGVFSSKVDIFEDFLRTDVHGEVFFEMENYYLKARRNTRYFNY